MDVRGRLRNVAATGFLCEFCTIFLAYRWDIVQLLSMSLLAYGWAAQLPLKGRFLFCFRNHPASATMKENATAKKEQCKGQRSGFPFTF